jgi:tetratricopeptide (TPR) repeat protein
LGKALLLAEQKADYTRRAGLGPWTQLADECHRLQILNSLGRYDEVLEAVQRLRHKLATLPDKNEVEESAIAWNVREALLDIGRSAAMGSEQWETALSLNAEILIFQQQRGADKVELASRRVNDYGPLLSLHRLAEARTLLKECRAIFEQAHAIREMGVVFSALAQLEGLEGNPATAVRFEQIALRYAYQTGQSEHCAMGHGDLATHLEYARSEPWPVLAHRLAASLIFFQTSSGDLMKSINLLACSTLPAAPPTFEQVVATVEQVEGVRFREMFTRLPAQVSDGAPSGDAAIAAVWHMALEEQARRKTENEG